MSTEELREYLGIVVDMEESIFLQNRLCQSIDQEIEKLKVPKQFEAPTKPTAPPAQPQPKEPKLSSLPHSIIGIIGGAIGLFFAVYLVLMFYEYYILNSIEGYSSSRKEMGDLWYVLAIIIPIAWVFIRIRDNKAVSRENKKKRVASENEYQDAIKKYQRRLVQYQEESKLYQSELKENQLKCLQDEEKQKLITIFWESQKKEIKKKLTISEERLQVIYQKNVVFPKYRNLTMVSSLYEYICAGRCTELEGHEGAYNILETEIRLDHIILQLDKVIAQLEQIKQNQFILYSAVQECNQRLGLIMGEIRQMAVSLNDFYNSSIRNSIQLNTQVAELNSQNAQLNAHIAQLQKASALTAYHTEHTQKELAYMNRMDYLAGRNDNVFFNHPPI